MVLRREASLHTHMQQCSRPLFWYCMHRYSIAGRTCLCEPRQHILMRHADMVEAEEAVVYAVVAKFGADVPHANAWQWQVGGHFPNGHHKGMRAIVFPSDEQSCHGHLQVCNFLKGLQCSGQNSALRLPRIIDSTVMEPQSTSCYCL